MTSSAKSDTAPRAKSSTMHGGVKFGLELGPLVLFFWVNSKFGLIHATGALVAATLVSLAIFWIKTRTVPKMLLIGALFVSFFGGLTIVFENEMFIKIKPTVINALFGVILLGGMMNGRVLLRDLFEAAFPIDDEGWRKMTVRWIIFFFAMAALNEAVWRSVDTDTWVSFKAFGLVPLSILFTLAQVPLIIKHQIKDESEDQTS